MPSRREFIQAGIAASILPGAIRVREAGANPPVTEPALAVRPLYAAIADERFAQSTQFGAEAERRGTKVVRISGDITDFWFNDLSLRWKEHPVAIAGLTTHGPLFCLERFAWDHRMRVVYRSQLTGELEEPLVSWVIA